MAPGARDDLPGGERREEFRWRLRCPVALRVEGPQADVPGPWVRLETLDLSAGGCRIRDPIHFLRPELRLQARLDLDDRSPALECRLHVVGPRPDAPDGGRTWGTRFLDLGELEQARIRRRLHAEYRNLRARRDIATAA